MNPTRTISLLLLASLASCGTVRKKAFEFSAIDDQRNPLTCVVVIDDKWPESNQGAIYTKSTVTIDFGDRQSVSVQVKHAQTNAEGVAESPPKRGERSRYKIETREIRLTDPSRQLFVLTPRTN